MCLHLHDRFDRGCVQQRSEVAAGKKEGYVTRVCAATRMNSSKYIEKVNAYMNKAVIYVDNEHWVPRQFT